MSWLKRNKIKFYCFYYEGSPIPVTIEAVTKNDARQKLRSIRATLPEPYKSSHVVGETVKSPLYGISKKNINGIKHIWVGIDKTPTGWIEEEKYNKK